MEMKNKIIAGALVVSVGANIAMKADHVRIVGRECVRIYASRGQNFQGFGIGGEKTTLGTPIMNAKIELCAGREEDLQPAVLGRNLKQYLEQKDEAMTEVLRTIINMLINFLEVNSTLMFANPMLSKYIPKNINDLWSMIIQTLNNQIEKINSYVNPQHICMHNGCRIEFEYGGGDAGRHPLAVCGCYVLNNAPALSLLSDLSLWLIEVMGTI